MEGIITIIIGIAIIVIGILGLLGNVSLLHSYHRKNVSPENMMAFAKLTGLGTLIIGIGLVIMGIFTLVAVKAPIFATIGGAVLIASFVIGLGICFYAMFKYNKGIF